MKRVLFLLVIFSSWNSHLQAQGPFYQGNTIKIVAGANAGTVYDVYARLIAQYMPKYIPGNPNTIVQNMPGAASMIAANLVYGVAKPDGLTLGAIQPTLYFDQLIGRKEVQFDWAKFTWIGSSTQSNELLYMRADTPYKTIHDVRKASEPPKCGATGTASTAYYLLKLLEGTIGTKFNIVTGYLAGTDVDLAIERGEMHCRAFTVAAFFAREPFHTWRKTGFVRALVQTGKKRDTRLPDVPTIYELMDQYRTPETERRLATVVLSGGEFGRPIVAPPGMSADRVKILREAFMKALSDPDLLVEVKKKNLEVDPTGGEELAALAKEVLAQPQEITGRLKKLLGD